jgi:hypothetical protein
MMDFKARIARDTATPKLKRLRAEIGSVKTIIEITYQAKAIIEQRTLDGLDADGAPFEPYSQNTYYAPMDAGSRPAGYPQPTGGTLTKSGKSMKFEGYDDYKGKLGFPTHVTLSLSNRMLAAIAATILSPTRSILSYNDREAATRAHGHTYGANNLPVREHLDIRDVRSKADLLKEFRAAMREVRRRAGLLKGAR